MFGQAVPLGVNLSSPLALFVVAVVIIVVALTVSTRRANTRPGPSFVPPAPPTAVALPDPQAGSWAAAQALFLDDPRAGCAWAEALVASILHDRTLAPAGEELAVRRFGAARSAVARGDASTDDLRRAFVEFRALYDSLSAIDTFPPQA